MGGCYINELARLRGKKFDAAGGRDVIRRVLLVIKAEWTTWPRESITQFKFLSRFLNSVKASANWRSPAPQTGVGSKVEKYGYINQIKEKRLQGCGLNFRSTFTRTSFVFFNARYGWSSLFQNFLNNPFFSRAVHEYYPNFHLLFVPKTWLEGINVCSGSYWQI